MSQKNHTLDAVAISFDLLLSKAMKFIHFEFGLKCVNT